MLYRLYFDFDGVIWDTWPYFYEMIRKNDNVLFEKMMNKTTNVEENLRIAQIFKSLEWDSVITNTKALRDSIISIKRLRETGLFDISILTHCNSNNEIMNKVKIRDEHITGIKLIPVKKSECKTTAVDPRGAILVDDWWVNVKSWNEAGGVGIKFSDKENDDYPYYHIDSLSKIPNIIEIVESQNVNKLVKIKR